MCAVVTSVFAVLLAAAAAAESTVDQLIERGEYAQAERVLRGQLADADAPVTEPAAVQLETLRRTRLDFSLNEEQLLAELGKSIDGVSQSDVERWRDEGVLEHRVIDGQVRYSKRTAGNLFRFSSEARQRRSAARVAADNRRAARRFDTTAHIEQLVALAEGAESAEVHPVRHRVKYKLAVVKDHPRVKPGAVVRAWLPYPQEYRQQTDVKLLAASPSSGRIAPAEAPQRSIYFEQVVGEGAEPPTFEVEFEFTTSAYCPKLDVAQVEPYDTGSEVYREYTAERLPHIALTPEVRRLADEIVAGESNPLVKARRIFAWVSENITWCSEMEYGIIPNLSAKGIEARRGDCGVQGLVFITLCRAAGIPARWQSGWQTKPGDWNMHDWSEFYVEPWGWLPADASYGLRDHADPRVRYFLCGNMDPYRLIVNLDYARPLDPPKTSLRSEPNDFQRGEIEIDGHNLYFNEWTWDFDVQTELE